MIYFMAFTDATASDHTIRRLSSVIQTLNTVAWTFDDLKSDPGSIDARWELLVLAEDLLNAASFITTHVRDIAWGQPCPFSDDDEDEDESL